MLSPDRPTKLIVNRRAIAAGIVALVGAPLAAKEALAQLRNVPVSFNPADFAGQMQDGLFLPDYRFPMVRIVFENGDATNWHRYCQHYYRFNETTERHEGGTRGPDRPNNRAIAIETCAPDKNGTPRYTQLAIG